MNFQHLLSKRLKFVQIAYINVSHIPLQNCRSSFGSERTLSSHVPAGWKYWPELHSRKSTAVGFSELGQGRVFLRLSASIPFQLLTKCRVTYFYFEQNLDTWWTVQDLVLFNRSCFVRFSLHTHIVFLYYLYNVLVSVCLLYNHTLSCSTVKQRGLAHIFVLSGVCWKNMCFSSSGVEVYCMSFQTAQMLNKTFRERFKSWICNGLEKCA